MHIINYMKLCEFIKYLNEIICNLTVILPKLLKEVNDVYRKKFNAHSRD